MEPTSSSALLICLALLASPSPPVFGVGGAAAFSLHSPVGRSPLAPAPSSALRSSGFDSGDVSGNTRAGHDYDAEELMSSEWETQRFHNMYQRFDHESWLAHRASDRFYRNVLRFGDSPVVRNLLDEVAVLVAICLALIGWNAAVSDGYTDFAMAKHAAPLAGALPKFLDEKLALPTEPFFLCGGPLGLLLVFRNDVSFNRYNQAVHHWETVITSLTNLLLMASKTSPSKDGVRGLGRASLALARTLQHEVSGGFDPRDKYEKDLRRIHSADGDAAKGERGAPRAEKALGSRNALFRSVYDLHSAVDAIATSDESVSNLDRRTMVNAVNAVATACAECERLYSTPIPLLYTRHALAFLSLWMTFLPLALYDVFASSWNHLGMIPAAAVICFLFFGIEEIAVSLEEPFSILPLGEFVGEYEENLEDVLHWMDEDKEKTEEQENGDLVVPSGKTKKGVYL